MNSARVYLLALFGVMVLSAPSAAQVSVQAQGRVISGVTNDPNPGNEGDTSDSLTEVTPSLQLTMRSGRMLHQAQYTFSSTIYMRNYEASSYSNRIQWTTLWQASQTLRFAAGIDATQGQQSSFALQQAGLAAGPQPSGDTVFMEIGINEGLDWALAPRWSLNHTLASSFYRPLSFSDAQPDTLSAEASVGLAREWSVFRLGIRALGGYNANLGFEDATIPTPPGTPTALPPDRCELLTDGGCRFPTEHILTSQLRAEGNFELSDFFSVELNAGMIQAATSADFGTPYIQPTMLAGVRFHGLRMEASLSFEHTLAASLQLGQTFRIERIQLTGRLPIGPAFRERWIVTASASYDYAQQIVISRHELGDFAHVWRAEAGLSYRINPNFLASARYQLAGQSDMDDPLGGQILGFNRHAILFGFEAHYPGRYDMQQPISRTALQPHRTSDRQWQQFFAPTPGAQPSSPPNQSQQ